MRHSHTLPSEFNKFGEADRAVSDDLRNALEFILDGVGYCTPCRAYARDRSGLGARLGEGRRFGTPSVRDNSGALASLPTCRYHSSNLMGANDRGDIVGSLTGDHCSHAVVWHRAAESSD